MKLADYVVTEAGFGADLGAEKFMDIKCRQTGRYPSAVVIVATVKALKYNGGVAKDAVTVENRDALQAGFANLARHIENVRKFGVPVIVAVNRFASDTEAALSEAWAAGGAGTEQLAQLVVQLAEQPSSFKLLYEDERSLKDKIETIVREIYRGAGVKYSLRAEKALQQIELGGYGHLPVCMAKTPYSFSDRPKLLGAPTDFVLEVSDVRLSNGAGFVVVETGAIMTMPGLPKVPAALNIRLQADGSVTGLS